MISPIELQRAIPTDGSDQRRPRLGAHGERTEQVEAAVDEAFWGQLALHPQAFDEALHAWLANVPELLGTEVHPFDQAAGINPFLTRVLALDTRRLPQVLPHVPDRL